MNVIELIERLSKFDPELEVRLGDWNEEWEPPNAEAVEYISLVTEPHWNARRGAKAGPTVPFKPYVCIGDTDSFGGG